MWFRSIAYQGYNNTVGTRSDQTESKVIISRGITQFVVQCSIHDQFDGIYTLVNLQTKSKTMGKEIY